MPTIPTKMLLAAVALTLPACGDPPSCGSCCSVDDASAICQAHVGDCELLPPGDVSGCLARFADAAAQAGQPDMDACLTSCDSTRR